jgi:hypothetical protein
MPFSSLVYSRESLAFVPYTSFESYLILSSELDSSHFIYYLDFKLVLCATCKFAISPNYIKGHILKHLSSYKGREAKVSKTTSLAASVLSLGVDPISRSLELVTNFQATINSFFNFQVLEVDSFYKCIACNYLFKSQQNIRRHRAQGHPSPKLDPYYIVIKGQSLEPTRSFFEVKLKEKSVEVDRSSLRPASPRPSLLEAENVASAPVLDRLLRSSLGPEVGAASRRGGRARDSI